MYDAKNDGGVGVQWGKDRDRAQGGCELHGVLARSCGHADVDNGAAGSSASAPWLGALARRL